MDPSTACAAARTNAGANAFAAADCLFWFQVDMCFLTKKAFFFNVEPENKIETSQPFIFFLHE
jgi:hypothetical protein